ncbi:hypothetical protein CHU95_02175 [Niveispirillum lacus]|uniref:Resolvase/invertase-type recombinase catalytic domain-containing protein n=1 Tax=Niveispirillum lacus TaxID=1981099 RepID=A0A255Z6V5_9PROT|nr:hypothetical protein CHU95_02175 [Niveispirillum lacus]
MPAMALYGYARASTPDQDVTLQVETLTRAGCAVVRAEKASGAGRGAGAVADGRSPTSSASYSAST